MKIKKLKLNNRSTFHVTRSTSSGFTLLEAMVAVAIFTVIMVVGISAILNVNSTYKKSQNFRSIIDSLNYMMEDVSRNVRLGSNYHCFNDGDDLDMVANLIVGPQNCASSTDGNLAVGIEPQEGVPSLLTDQFVYHIKERNSDITDCELRKSTDGGQSFVSVTPPEIRLNCTLSGFNVYGTDISVPENSPRVVIRLNGVVNYKTTVTPFAIQTTASQRTVNVTP